MNDAEETAYTNGERLAWRMMLRECLRHLGYDDPESTGVVWTAARIALIVEREEAIAQLRSVCGEHGDNDWDEKLRLADIIDKHLARHLEVSK